MWEWIRQLDRLLRGEVTSLTELRRERFEIPVVGLSVVVSVLGMIYGACMGLFAVTGSGSGAPMQIPASMVKVPALFLLTLLVTFPSLYVFNALVGSRLTWSSMLGLLVGALAVMLAVLSSLGPIVAFFAVSTTSYRFMLLLNVAVYALSGFLGLAFLLQTLHRMSVARMSAPVEPVNPTESSQPRDPNAPLDYAITDPNDPRYSPPPVEDFGGQLGAIDRLKGHVLGPHTRVIFRIWVVVFGIVGAQMAWVLRPFVGRPDRPFEWFRARESNFFEALWHLITGFGATNSDMIAALLQNADSILRGGTTPEGADPRPRDPVVLAMLVVFFGMSYGAVMGTFSATSWDRAVQIVYAAVKVPLLLLVTFLISLPSFFVLNTLSGLRRDFSDAVRALVGTQAALTIVLASLALLTAVWYASVADYNSAILFNAVMFAVASFSAQLLLRRLYRPLIDRNPRHRILLRLWIVIYVFVGIQMGWVLRPFVGSPTAESRFFREGAFSNAYVAVFNLVYEVVLRPFH